MTHMKTTIELPDALLRDAKAAAVHRRTTLKAVITHALEREVRAGDQTPRRVFTIDDDGLPHLPARGAQVTSRLVSKFLDEDDL